MNWDNLKQGKCPKCGGRMVNSQTLIKKTCEHCGAPLHCINICANCKKPVDPIKLSTLLWMAGGLVLIGYLLGFCTKM